MSDLFDISKHIESVPPNLVVILSALLNRRNSPILITNEELQRFTLKPERLIFQMTTDGLKIFKAEERKP